MFTKLIVGVDGRDGGSDALALARTLAGDDARIVLVNAYPHDPHPSRAEVGGYEELLHADAVELLRGAGDDRRYVRRAIPDHSPARALHRLAEAEHAELIVTGSCHRGAVGRVLLGDVSRAVVHDSPCSVAIAPRGYAEAPGAEIREIGVGLDEGREAAAAATSAGALAAQAGAELRLLTAVRLPVAFAPAYAYAYDWPELRQAGRDAAHALQDRWIADLPAPATGHVVDGPAAEELERLSREVDLLVLGSRGWGAVRRAMVGSTADRVMHHAGCPVILVPGPAGPESEDEHRHSRSATA